MSTRKVHLFSIEGFRNGELADLKTYFEQHQRYVRISLMFTGNMAVSEDIVAETANAIWKKRFDFDTFDQIDADTVITVMNLSIKFLKDQKLESEMLQLPVGTAKINKVKYSKYSRGVDKLREKVVNFFTKPSAYE